MERTKYPVGVRELRQNLSVYLRRVVAGQTFEVTEHGRPIAVLAPLPEALTALDHLYATGRATRPVGDLLDLGPPSGETVGHRLTEALQEERAERL
ncbi:MAG TPA: type II toxin-antitoxin system prevent-host-death family antitoxin [Chloroflexota bacterium]|jgi:prevent-host-death family protein|nr:type II toxin-antitoxin system prevent-host-death family antitoxin [Chloroflexota bacterium]